MSLECNVCMSTPIHNTCEYMHTHIRTYPKTYWAYLKKYTIALGAAIMQIKLKVTGLGPEFYLKTQLTKRTLVSLMICQIISECL